LDRDVPDRERAGPGPDLADQGGRTRIQNCGPAGTCDSTSTGTNSTKVFALTDTTPVPVPMTLFLLGAGLLALGGAGRYHRAQ
jgi:hypothetical protein